MATENGAGLRLLLAQFGVAVRAPADVARLNALIFTLAVQGKLVSRIAGDGSGRTLLERNLAARKELEKKGQLPTQKPLPPISENEIPFPIPDHWVWCQLGQITTYGIADKLEANQVEDGTWVLDLEDIEKSTSRLLQKKRSGQSTFKSTKNAFKKGDVLYGKLRPYLDKALVADEDGVCTTEIIPFHGFVDVDPAYLRLALKRADFIQYANSKTYGMNLPRLGTEDARKALLPLPPTAEQHRIVARVDELLAAADALAGQLAAAGAQRRRFHRAALARLVAGDGRPPTADGRLSPAPPLPDARPAPDSRLVQASAAPTPWALLEPHFDALYADPAAVAELKAAVLQLAVMGRLVGQDANDEPAGVLLGRIAAQRAKELKGNNRISEEFPEVGIDEFPFEIPSTWAWSRLGSVFRFIDYRGKTPNKTEHGLPLITAKNVRFGYLSEEPREYANPAVYDSWMTRGIPKKGDLLFTTEAPLGNVAVLNSDAKALFAQRIITLQSYGASSGSFFRVVLMSSPIREVIYSKATGTTAMGIKASKLKLIPVPIPPLAEQHRIVAKVDELFALADEAAGRGGAAEAARGRFLGAIAN